MYMIFNFKMYENCFYNNKIISCFFELKKCHFRNVQLFENVQLTELKKNPK